MMNLSCQSYLNNKTFIRISGFGMTESSPVTHFQPAEGAILGGCGVPIPNTIAKIIDLDSGKALGPNQVGIGIY
jgi:long-chain acyl-CoA synthetase